ncbi:S41 family peptidase [Telmatocola sphagniphila]|uniref:S41 family peptidase n=1 Tax=Telmatocola sphagniphila TaxID=1123043 RepID=A0A8E6B9Q7_9BACT|nr:S41 family peptidase [Telmatocola sphagniphila]QVL33153.1 S41 family peptidase [Telmatocola sphagniphila]
MSRLMRSCLGLAVLLFGLINPLSAADWKSTIPKSYVVIVGVGQFGDKQLKSRPSAEVDAKAYYDLFTDPKIGTVPADHVFLFTSAADEARKGKVGTKENILSTLKDINSKVTADELVYLIIVGQGGAVGTQGCIFVADSNFKDRANNALKGSDFETSLKGLKSQLCTFFDVNFKGFEAGDEAVLNPQLKEFQDVFLGTKGKDSDEDTAVDGRVMVFSGRTMNDPLILDNKGLFTKVAIDALKGAADKDGYEADGVITLDEFTKYIEKETPILAQKLGKDNRDKLQFPIVFAGLETHFVMSHNPVVFPKVEEHLKALDKLEADKKIDKDIGEEARKYISRMPKLKALQELRKDYVALVEGKKSPEEIVKDRAKILEEMVLPRKDAVRYAETVLAGIAEVRSIFIKDTKEDELIANGVKGLFQRAEVKLPKDITAKLLTLGQMRRSEKTDLLADARVVLGKREDLEDYKDADITFQMITAKLGDNYTTYYDKDKVAEVDKQTQGSFSGIGVVIRADLAKDALRVVTPIKGSPAYKAGLRTGDLITSIYRTVDRNGKPLATPETTSTKGMDTIDAVKLITGKAGTNVSVTIEREGEKDPIVYEITRGMVEVESVMGYKRKDDDTWDYYIDPATKIAYIYLSQFSRKSATDMEKVLQKLEADKVAGLILDLRFNPGGYLDVVHHMSELFVDDGVVVSIRPRVGRGETKVATRTANRKSTYTRFPIACLINGESASASEILSAFLQDHTRAVIMGERSYGKGSVQTIVPFAPTGGEFKITIATFWRPNGKNLNKATTKGTPEEDWGVRPESQYELKLTPQETNDLRERLVNDWSVIPRRDLKAKEPVKPFKDRQLDMALQYLRAQIKS